jgi:hypothetical protein
MKKIILILLLVAFTNVGFCDPPQIKTTELSKIIQLVIDLPALQGFLHPKVTDRVPLIISDKLIGKELKLSKFDQPVLILSKEEIGNKPYIEITKMVIQNKLAYIEFSYPIEGVVGRVNIKQTSKLAWLVENSKVVEQ